MNEIMICFFRAGGSLFLCSMVYVSRKVSQCLEISKKIVLIFVRGEGQRTEFRSVRKIGTIKTI